MTCYLWTWITLFSGIFAHQGRLCIQQATLDEVPMQEGRIIDLGRNTAGSCEAPDQWISSRFICSADR